MGNIIKIEAEFTLHVDIECPYCEHDFNLFDCSEMTDDGMIYNKLMPDDDHWSDAGKNFNKKVDCPDCKKEILISNISY